MSKPTIEEQVVALAVQFGHLLNVVDALGEALKLQATALEGQRQTLGILQKYIERNQNGKRTIHNDDAEQN